MVPPASVSAQVMVDAVLHTTLLALHNRVLVSDVVHSNPLQQSGMAVAYKLVILTVSIQVSVFYASTIWAWIVVLAAGLAHKAGEFGFVSGAVNRLRSRMPQWIPIKIDRGSLPWMCTHNGKGWWVASLVLKIILVAFAAYFSFLNYMSLAAATSAALYTSDIYRLDNKYAMLTEVSTTLFHVLVLQVCLAVWTIVQLCHAFYSLGRDFNN